MLTKASNLQNWLVCKTCIYYHITNNIYFDVKIQLKRKENSQQGRLSGQRETFNVLSSSELGKGGHRDKQVQMGDRAGRKEQNGNSANSELIWAD